MGEKKHTQSAEKVEFALLFTWFQQQSLTAVKSLRFVFERF